MRLDCDGGVEPEENLELRLDIQEFRRPPTGFGLLFCGAGDGADALSDFGSPFFSLGSSFTSGSFTSLFAMLSVSLFTSGAPAEDDGGRAGLLFDRILRWEFGGLVAESFSALGRSLTVDVKDLVRER